MAQAGAAGDVTAPFSALNGPFGVLVLHGFTGSPASMRPLAEAFAVAGFTVELPLLPGHGTTPEDLATTGYAQWSAHAESEYLALAAASEQVVVVGLSMGGTLACQLAADHPEVAGAVLINPFIEPPATSFLELVRSAAASGVPFLPSIGSDVARPGIDGRGYDRTPLSSLSSLVEAIPAVAARLGEVTCPVLAFTSAVDHVVPPGAGEYLAEHLAGPFERVVLENSFHVATLDNDAAELEARAVAFVQKVTAR